MKPYDEIQFKFNKFNKTPKTFSDYYKIIKSLRQLCDYVSLRVQEGHNIAIITPKHFKVTHETKEYFIESEKINYYNYELRECGSIKHYKLYEPIDLDYISSQQIAIFNEEELRDFIHEFDNCHTLIKKIMDTVSPSFDYSKLLLLTTEDCEFRKKDNVNFCADELIVMGIYRRNIAESRYLVKENYINYNTSIINYALGKFTRRKLGKTVKITFNSNFKKIKSRLLNELKIDGRNNFKVNYILMNHFDSKQRRSQLFKSKAIKLSEMILAQNKLQLTISIDDYARLFNYYDWKSAKKSLKSKQFKSLFRTISSAPANKDSLITIKFNEIIDAVLNIYENFKEVVNKKICRSIDKEIKKYKFFILKSNKYLMSTWTKLKGSFRIKNRLYPIRI